MNFDAGHRLVMLYIVSFEIFGKSEENLFCFSLFTLDLFDEQECVARCGLVQFLSTQQKL